MKIHGLGTTAIKTTIIIIIVILGSCKAQCKEEYKRRLEKGKH